MFSSFSEKVFRRSILLFLFLFPVLTYAQSTLVSGQVTDTNGQTWNNGTITFQFFNLYPQGGYIWTGGAFNPNAQITGTLSITGAYSNISVPSNTAISPALSQWRTVVCSGTIPPTCVQLLATITGGTQTLNFTPAPPTVPPGTGNTAYADNEIQPPAVGGQYYNTTSNTLRVCQVVTAGVCTTWASIGGGVPGGTAGQFIVNDLTGLFTGIGPSPAGSIPTSQGPGALPQALTPGLVDSVNSPVTTTPYTLACDSSTTEIDRAHVIRLKTGASAVTVPLSTAAGCLGGFVTTVVNENAGTIAFNATSPDTFSVYNGSNATTGLTTVSMSSGQSITLNQGAAGIWEFRITAAYPTNTCNLNGNSQTAAKVNVAYSAGCVDLWVGMDATTLSDATITVPKSSYLHFTGGPSVTYTLGPVRMTDSTSDSTGTGGIDCPNGATLKLANTQNVDFVSQVNFATLTGTTNANGLNRAYINGCIIDGNKANNSTGWPVRLYGRGTRLNATVQNGAQGGAWLEQHNAASFTNPPDDDAQTSNVLRAINNGGDGVNIPQGEGWKFDTLVTWGNSAWGIETAAPMNVGYLQSFLNTSGGCHIKSGGQMFGTNVNCTSAAGVGLQIDTGAGSSDIANGTFAGPTGLSVGNVQNTSISGQVQNSTVAGLVINGAVGDYFNLNFLGNQGVQVNFASGGADSTYIFTGNAVAGSPTCTSGTIPASATIFMDIAGPAGCSTYTQFRARTLNAGGWAPQLPQSNGTMFSTGNSDGVYGSAESAGCTTAASIGGNCATDITITWATPFADTTYNVFCTGIGIASGVPSGPYVVSQTSSVIHVNYFAITAVAAAYGNVFCTASHR